MSAVTDGKFNCDACGKRYTWKPQLAGKRAKCACGAVIVVPDAPSPPPAAEPPPQDDLYDFAEPPPAPAATAAHVPAPMATPAVQTIAYQSAPTERERKRFSAETMIDRPRDFYIPIGLLVIGFLAILGWASAEAGPAGMIVMSIFTLFMTVVKTVILIGLAIVYAPLVGVSFGGLWTAVLKFAAIIVFTDAANLWLDSFIGSVGGRTGGRLLMMSLLLTAALISFLSYYLFDMDGDEARTFALPFALASWVIGLIMTYVIVAVLT